MMFCGMPACPGLLHHLCEYICCQSWVKSDLTFPKAATELLCLAHVLYMVIWVPLVGNRQANSMLRLTLKSLQDSRFPCVEGARLCRDIMSLTNYALNVVWSFFL